MKKSHLFPSRFSSSQVRAVGLSADVYSLFRVCDSGYHRVRTWRLWGCRVLLSHRGHGTWSWLIHSAGAFAPLSCLQTSKSCSASDWNDTTPPCNPPKPWYHEGRCKTPVSLTGLTDKHSVVKMHFVDTDWFWKPFSISSASLCVALFQIRLVFLSVHVTFAM